MITQEQQQSAEEWAVVRLGLRRCSTLLLAKHPTYGEALEHARERNFRTLTNPHIFYMVLPVAHRSLRGAEQGEQANA